MTAKQICQSCSMPMRQDVLKGREKDGSINEKYCNLCYQDGEFKNPNLSVEQMQKIVEDVLCNKRHWPAGLARFAATQIPRLERWYKA